MRVRRGVVFNRRRRSSNGLSSNDSAPSLEQIECVVYHRQTGGASMLQGLERGSASRIEGDDFPIEDDLGRLQCGDPGDDTRVVPGEVFGVARQQPHAAL